MNIYKISYEINNQYDYIFVEAKTSARALSIANEYLDIICDDYRITSVRMYLRDDEIINANYMCKESKK